MIVELISSFFGSLGFGMVFNVRRGNLFSVALGGLLVCGTHLLCFEYLHFSLFLSSLVAGAVCQVFSEIMARISKSPATIFYITSLIPLIPGGALFRTMDAAVEKDFSLFRLYGIQTIHITLGLAIGISCVTALLYFFQRKK